MVVDVGAYPKVVALDAGGDTVDSPLTLQAGADLATVGDLTLSGTVHLGGSSAEVSAYGQRLAHA